MDQILHPTIRYSVLVIVSNCPCSFFGSSRGLRLGDPLFPMLFILVMEALNKMINKIMAGGYLRGFSIVVGGQSFVRVFHFLFVDGTYVFCDADSVQLIFLR